MEYIQTFCCIVFRGTTCDLWKVAKEKKPVKSLVFYQTGVVKKQASILGSKKGQE